MPLKYPLTEAGPGDPIKSDDWNNIIRSLKDLYGVTDALASCALAVRVVDENGGKPVTNAAVMIRSSGVEGGSGLPAVMVGLRPALGFAGVYFGLGVPEGNFVLVIEAPGFKTGEEKISVKPDRGWAVTDIKLIPGGDMGVVPMLFGIKAVDAVKMITIMGWKTGIIMDIYGNTIPSADSIGDTFAKVLSQEPPPGATAPYAGGVNLVVSAAQAAPAAQTAMPNVVGLTVEKAIKTLEEQGFKGLAGAGASGDDLVTIQTPVAGTLAAPGSTVVLTVKEETVTVTVPGVHGLSADDAANVFSLVGLKTGKSTGAGIKKSVVVSQSPNAGETAKQGTSVSLICEPLTGNIKMPDLRSFTIHQAIKVIYEYGLKPGFLIDSFGRMGTSRVYDMEKIKQAQMDSMVVVSQIPAADLHVIDGTYVYLAAEQSDAAQGTVGFRKTPGLTGLTLAEAVVKAEADGFILVVRGDTSGKINMGSRKVVSQVPQEGDKLALGGTIRVDLETAQSLAVDDFKLKSRSVATIFKNKSVDDVQTTVLKDPEIKAIILKNKTFDALTGMEREILAAFFVKAGLTTAKSPETTLLNVYEDLVLLCNL